MSAASVLRRIALLGRGWCPREALGAWAGEQGLSPDELDRDLELLLVTGHIERRWLSRNGSWIRVAEYRAIRDMAPPAEARQPAPPGPLQTLRERIAAELALAPGSTRPEIQSRLHSSKARVSATLRRMVVAGEVERAPGPRPHRYRLSEAA